MTDVFSPKQKSALGLVKSGGLRRINLLEGSVRSGKTWISMIMWGFWVASAPENGAYLMAGKTLTTMRRNVLEPMCGLFGSCFTYSLSKKEGRLFGRKIYLEGASNAQAESKIRGMTLNGAYCDELSLFPEDFFAMLLSRLSVSGAKLIATTNPDNPGHWLKRNYLDNDALDLLDLKFTLDDNPFLPAEYVRALKTEYTGVFYDRFILGNWTAAEGRIYEDFSQKCIIPPQELRQRLAGLFLAALGVALVKAKAARALVAAARVGGHADDRVGKIHRASLRIVDLALVQNLHENVHHVRMSLFDFVEQNHRVRAAANFFSQLTGFIVANISRRRTDHTCHRVLLHELRHVQTNQRIVGVEQFLRQHLDQFCLSYAGRSHEDKGSRTAARA